MIEDAVARVLTVRLSARSSQEDQNRSKRSESEVSVQSADRQRRSSRN